MSPKGNDNLHTKIKATLLLLLVIGLLIIVFMDNDAFEETKIYQAQLPQQSQQTKQQIAVSPTPTFTATVTPVIDTFTYEQIKSLKESIIHLVNESANAKTVSNDDRIKSIQVLNKSVIVELNADVSITIEMVVSIVLNKSFNIYLEMFKSNLGVDDITLYWFYPEVDARGNRDFNPLLSMNLSKENEGTFHWDKMIFLRLPEVVDKYEEFFESSDLQL